MKRTLSASLILLWTAGAGMAQKPAATPAPSVRSLKFPQLKPIPIPQVATFTLANGLRLFLLEDHEIPTLRGTARVRTGNLLDPRDKIGLADVTGMVMRTGGTKTQTGDEIDLALENVAASVEANIGETSGSVSFSALKENADQVMAVFKDVLTAPEFREDKIELAKTQLRSVISRRNDEPRSIEGREFADLVYGKESPYGWRMEYATLDRIGRADLQEFHRRYFFPKNTLLALWGDFDTAQMKARVEKLFADWTVEQPTVPPFPKVEAKPAPGTYLAAKPDVTQTFFAMGQLGGEIRDKDYAALEILSDILGGGFQSRLIQRVRTQMGNAYNISADWDAEYDHPGLFEISGSTKSFSTVETLKAVREEVDRVRTSEVTEAELETAKETALNSLVFAFDTKSKTLGRMLTYEYYGYPRDFIQQYQAALQAVTRADVLRVAKEHLRPEEFTIVAVGNPADFGQPLDSLGGPVHSIDLTIPQAKQETAKADASSLQKGKQILARAQQAAGGADKLAGVRDYVQTMELKVAPAGGALQVKETNSWRDPNLLRQESVMPVGKVVVFTDGKGGWIVTPQGSGALAGPNLTQTTGELFRSYFRLLISDRIPGRTVNATGDDTVEISDDAGHQTQVSFDPTTGLLKTMRYQSVNMVGPPLTVEQTFSDFRETGGIRAPYRVAIRQGGAPLGEATVSDWKLNVGLKPEDLEKRP
jgi:zinc protease